MLGQMRNLLVPKVLAEDYSLQHKFMYTIKMMGNYWIVIVCKDSTVIYQILVTKTRPRFAISVMKEIRDYSSY